MPHVCDLVLSLAAAAAAAIWLQLYLGWNGAYTYTDAAYRDSFPTLSFLPFSSPHPSPQFVNLSSSAVGSCVSCSGSGPTGRLPPFHTIDYSPSTTSFLHFAKYYGVSIHPNLSIAFTSIPSCHPSFRRSIQRGFVAHGSIAPGEILLTVPAELAITDGKAMDLLMYAGMIDEVTYQFVMQLSKKRIWMPEGDCWFLSIYVLYKQMERQRFLALRHSLEKDQQSAGSSIKPADGYGSVHPPPLVYALDHAAAFLRHLSRSSLDALELPLPKPYTGRPKLPQQSEDRGKLTIVLGLDETLVHSRFEDLHPHGQSIPVVSDPSRVCQSEISTRIPESCNFTFLIGSGASQQRVCTSFRPQLPSFLKYISTYFEPVIFTSALPIYADPLLDYLEENYMVGGKGFRGRLYRDSTQTFEGRHYVKDIRKIGRAMKRTVMVDNNDEYLIANMENAIYIPDYLDNQGDRWLGKLLDTLIELDRLTKPESHLGPNSNSSGHIDINTGGTSSTNDAEGSDDSAAGAGDVRRFLYAAFHFHHRMTLFPLEDLHTAMFDLLPLPPPWTPCTSLICFSSAQSDALLFHPAVGRMRFGSTEQAEDIREGGRELTTKLQQLPDFKDVREEDVLWSLFLVRSRIVGSSADPSLDPILGLFNTRPPCVTSRSEYEGYRTPSFPSSSYATSESSTTILYTRWGLQAGEQVYTLYGRDGNGQSGMTNMDLLSLYGIVVPALRGDLYPIRLCFTPSPSSSASTGLQSLRLQLNTTSRYDRDTSLYFAADEGTYVLTTMVTNGGLMDPSLFEFLAHALGVSRGGNRGDGSRTQREKRVWQAMELVMKEYWQELLHRGANEWGIQWTERETTWWTRKGDQKQKRKMGREEEEKNGGQEELEKEVMKMVPIGAFHFNALEKEEKSEGVVKMAQRLIRSYVHMMRMCKVLTQRMHMRANGDMLVHLNFHS